MKVVKPSFVIESEIDGEKILKHIEKCGRTCYKSENKITEESAKKFIEMLLKNGHESVIEHYSITVRLICDRGVSHELVRHRLASYSQESTRYCNYNKNQFGNELTFVKPNFWDVNSPEYLLWESTCRIIENAYLQMIYDGAKPQEARSILPNSLKTEIVVSANLREWRTIFKQRTSLAAHPDIRVALIPVLKEFKKIIPVVFDDIEVKEE